MYESDSGHPVEIGRLDLPKELSVHEFRGRGPHPLDAVDVVIAGSFGEGFALRMAARGVAVASTGLTDPVEAVREYLARPVPGRPTACGCEHGHGHDQPEAAAHHSHPHGRGSAAEAVRAEEKEGQGHG